MKKYNNLVLNFTNVYTDEIKSKQNDMIWIDCTDIDGCNMYCTKEAKEEIIKRILPYGISGIHFLDSGNYHYVTKFMVEKIEEPFSLVLIDHHTDMQKPVISELTSCGGWAYDVLKEHPYLQQLILIGPNHKNLEQLKVPNKEKLIGISDEELNQHKEKADVGKIRRDVPVYISVDKDVLDEYYAKTNWNQGTMSVELLEQVLQYFITNMEVLGVDLCGEFPVYDNLPEYYESIRVNRGLNQELYQLLIRLLSRKKMQ